MKFDRGLYAYIVTGEREAEAVAFLEKEFDHIDDLNLLAGYEICTADDRAAVLRKCKELFFVSVKADI